MSTPLEQARAIAQARHFLSELCAPGKIKRVPSEVRREALQSVMDWNPKPEYWERLANVASFEADMEKARKILEETE